MEVWHQLLRYVVNFDDKPNKVYHTIFEICEYEWFLAKSSTSLELDDTLESAIYYFAKKHFLDHGTIPSNSLIIEMVSENAGLSLDLKLELTKTVDSISRYACIEGDVYSYIDRVREEYAKLLLLTKTASYIENLKDKDIYKVAERIQKNVDKIVSLGKKTSAKNNQTIKSAVELADLFEARIKSPEGMLPPKMRYGFDSLDKKLTGIYPGEYVGVVAPSSVGKSFVSQAILYNNVYNDDDGVYIMASTEMSEDQLMARILAYTTKINSKKILGLYSDFTSEDKQRFDTGLQIFRSMQERFFLIPKGAFSTQKELEKCIQSRVGRDLSCVKGICLDYIDLMSPNSKQSESYVNAVSAEMQDFTRDTGVCLITPTQASADTSRKGKSGTSRNQMGSVKLYNDMDVCLALEEDPDHIFKIDEYGRITPAVLYLTVIKARMSEKSVEPIPLFADFTTATITEAGDAVVRKEKSEPKSSKFRGEGKQLR